MRRFAVSIILGVLTALAGSAWAGGESATIMVAASAKDAVSEVAEAFKKDTGAAVKIVPGGSNALAAQILADAPADLYLSANQEWAEKVKAEGYVARMQPLLGNELVLIVPTGNPARVKTPADLAGKAVERLALAGEKVPAGRYAEQALRSAKLYDALVRNSKIARGQDVRMTLSYVERSEAEAGIVYATDALLSGKVEVVHTFDPATYDRIVYPLALLKAGEKNPAAVKFFAFLASAKAEAIFRKHGFVLVKV